MWNGAIYPPMPQDCFTGTGHDKHSVSWVHQNDNSVRKSQECYLLNSTLLWRHNGHDGVSNHQLHECLLNRSSRCISKKTSSSGSLAFVRGNHRRPVNSPHKWSVTRKMFSFDDVIMQPIHGVPVAYMCIYDLTFIYLCPQLPLFYRD